MYPTIKVVTANPQPSLSVKPLPVQPKVVVQPLKPQPKVVVTQPKTNQTVKVVQPQPDTRPITVSGASPFQKKPSSVIGSAVQGYWKMLTEPIVKLNKASLGLTKAIAQGTARSGATIGITGIKGQEKLQEKVFGNVIGIKAPETVYNKYLFGDKPVGDFTSEGSETFKSFGAEGLAKNPFASFALGGVFAGLDLTPGGKADDVIKQLAKSDDVVSIIKTLKKSGVADNIANDYAPIIAKTTSQTEVKQILGQISRVSKQVDPLIQEARKYKSAEEFVNNQNKLAQLDKVNKSNPMSDDYHTGIRSVEDIKTFKEAFNDPESFVYPDFTKETASKALRDGKVTIYSSKPLHENTAQFVTPSKMQASDYAGSGKVYSKTVNLDDVAWINGDEGQLTGSSKSQLTDIWNKANSVGKIDPRSGVKNLNITDDAYKVIDDNAEALRPKLEKLKGSPMTAEEVKEAAKKSDVFKKVITRDESLRNVAQVTKTRESIAALAEGKGIKKEFAEQLLALKSQMSDTARKLRAAGFSDDAVEVNSKADILNKLDEAGFELDEIIEASKNVDFDSPKEVAKFYRQFIKPTFMERLDEWRYGNMLSSPLTHLVNITSNAIQAAVLNPATKLASGLSDNVASKLFGKEQEHFLREVPQVYRGMFNSFGEALNNSWSVFRGNKALHRLDVNRIPSGSKLTVVQRQFLQALEAGDAFFRTLIRGGEMESLASKYTKMGKQFTQETLEKEADKVAEYFTFRQGLDYTNKSKQGYLLSGIDGLTSLVMSGRNLPYVGKPIGWFVPFVQTPMNILKQGVEYSPLGVLTLPGNAKKVEQFSKAMVGSTVFAGAGYLALNNRTTWGVPTNEKEKELFYASGMQPYSVKIGNKWVSYSKLGPLAYPIAMASAIKYYWQDNPKSVDQNTAEKIGQIMGGVMKFFSDQSYVQGIAELGGFVQGDFGTGAIKSAENLIGQAVPLSSLQRWVNNIIDPVFRKTESKFDLKTVLKNLQAQLITQSDIQEPYLRPDGTESKRPFPFLNALNPFKMSKEDDSFKEKYDLNNELQKLSVQKKANDEDEKERITPILDHVTELEKQGKIDEAQQIKDSLSEEDWNTFKKIRQTRRDTEVANSKPEMLEVYKQVTYLKSIGQMDEAQRIKDSLTEEEWSAFKSVRNLAEGAK